MAGWGSSTSPVTNVSDTLNGQTYAYVEANTTISFTLSTSAPGLVVTGSSGLSWINAPGTYSNPYSFSFATAGTGTISIRIIPQGFTTLNIYAVNMYTHTIAYNANGGSGSMGNTSVKDTNSGNTNVTFASNGFTAPTGYYFAGWRINNTGTVYQPGNTYAVGGNGSVTAYANWLPIPIAKTNVNVNGSWVKGSVHVNVNGTWKEGRRIYVKVNGAWEESIG